MFSPLREDAMIYGLHFHPTVCVLSDQNLTQVGEVRRSTILWKNGLLGTLEVLKAPSTEEAFLNLSGHILVFEHSRLNFSFIRYAVPDHNRGPDVWHLINFIWVFQAPHLTGLLIDKLRQGSCIRKYNLIKGLWIIFSCLPQYLAIGILLCWSKALNFSCL